MLPNGLSPTARRRLVRAGLVAAVLALLWTGAFLYAPPLIRHQAEKIGSDKLGRQVGLGTIAFNPWTLTLDVDDIAIASSKTTAAPQLQIKRIHADIAWLSLLRFAPIVDRLEITALQLRLVRTADGGLDIDDVLQRLATKDPAADDEPARFALHNIVVSAGSADVIDEAVEARHQLRGLELAVPFVSTLPSQREIKVEPRLAFVLDGSRFDSAAAATPFSATGQGEATVKLQAFDVAPFLGYLPKNLPVRLKSALLSADLRLAFEQRPKLSLRISGTVEIGRLAVTDPADAAAGELVSAGSVKIAIDELRPLEGLVRLRRIDVDAPHVLASRAANGKVNLMLEAESPGGGAVPIAPLPLPTSAASAASAVRAASAPKAARPAAGESRWKVVLAELSVRAGSLDWRDATVSPRAELVLSDFVLDAGSIGWPLDAPVVFKGEGRLAGVGGGADKVAAGSAAGAAATAARFAFEGKGNGAGATVTARIDAMPLALAAPYLRGVLAVPLAGDLNAALALDWKPGRPEAAIKVRAERIAVDKLRLGDAKAPELAADRIELTGVSVDTATRAAVLGKLAVQAPRVRIERGPESRWNVERWRVAAATSASPTTAASASASASSSASASASASASSSSSPTATPTPPWSIALGELAIDQGRVGFVDRGLAVPVALDLSDIALQVSGFALDAPKRVPFRLRARVAVPAGPTGVAVGSGFAGSVDARGDLGAVVAGVPGSAKAALVLKDLPLHLLDPYLDDVLDIDVQKAQTSFKGEVAYTASAAGPRFGVRGDATIDDFRANSTVADRGAPQRALAMVRDGAAGRQLLSWKTLTLRGIDVAVAPNTAPQVAIAETALGDFFARVVLDETGRLNLQDVTRAAPAAAAASGASAPSGASGSSVATTANAAAATASARLAPIVRFGPIGVVNGRVNFADRFVKPNYSANLSELSGKLGSFSSQGAAPGQPPLLAELELRGRVEGTAALEIAGKVNPLAKPLALDIHAKVRDLELPPLSPYAVKYAGYGIDRGKMSVDLAYVVAPDGQLTATNKIVLNQLAFGDKVEGAPASLPVKLAVALLADRHGVIDLDLPVSGSINDPQFSLGGLIWKVIGNLIAKAVTAPFSLLGAALGGGSSSEASTIEFAPGTATLLPAARAGLDKIATALADRPQLAMTVTGESRLAVEREAWKRERLQQIVRAEKRRAGLAAGAAASAEITVSEAEYPALLKEVYKRADIVKPKNVVGLAKDLPTAEMEAALLAGIAVTDEAMQQLAVRRGVVVRDYLAAQKLPTDRLFLGAPRTTGSDGAWTPRADLKLSTD